MEKAAILNFQQINVEPIKFLLMDNVFVKMDFSVLMEFVYNAQQEQLGMVNIVTVPQQATGVWVNQILKL